MSGPPPFLVKPAVPVLLLMTPERMPAVTMVPVLPLLLTVTTRLVPLRLMALVISVSPSAVEEPRTRAVAGLKLPEPQVRAAPPLRLTTRRSVVPAAKPVLPAVSWTCPAAVPRVRVNEVPATSSTPPLKVMLLLVGTPRTAPVVMARRAPPEIVVVPV